MQAINNGRSICLCICTHYFISSTSQNIEMSLRGRFSLLMLNESICSETE